jgi:CheY-like chemotaxis protein
MRRRILLVSDNAELIADLHTMLQGYDYQLLVTSDPATGQELALVQKPLVAIIDLDMQEGAGRELTHGLRQHGSTLSLPVILMAGQPSQVDYRFAFTHGVAKFLTKPIRHLELIHAVDELVERCRFQQA